MAKTLKYKMRRMKVMVEKMKSRRKMALLKKMKEKKKMRRKKVQKRKNLQPAQEISLERPVRKSLLTRTIRK